MLRRIVLSLSLLVSLSFAGCDYVTDELPAEQSAAAPRAPMFQPSGQPAAPIENTIAAPVPQTSVPMNIPQSNAAQVRVGLLVPLSGEKAELGQNLLDAGMLALYDKYAGGQNFPAQVVIIPKDTEGTPQGAMKAAGDAVDEGAQLLLGPVFSEEVKAAAQVAKQRKVPLVSFSNNKTIADSNTFLFGFMPDQAVARVMDEAYGRGFKKIGVIAPDNEFGQLVSDAARKVSTTRGMELIGVELYRPGTTDFTGTVERLLGGRARSGQVMDVDAVMIAEGGSAARVLANTVFALAGKPVQLLGTGLWDDPSVTGSRELSGGWFASSPLRQSKGFEQRFRNYYSYTPLRIASLAYDAVALATTLAMMPEGADFTAMRITDVNGFNGPANGIFRFQGDGSIERGLSILQITPTGFQETSPAPRAFLGQ